MTRRALLIGAQILGLDGVENDVAAMAKTLAGRGFDPAVLTGPAASRAGVLAAYDDLIAHTKPDDVVVVYYSGHGALLRPPAASAATAAEPSWPTRMDMQFILPTDYCESVPGDFRGITATELSARLARLTAVTDNVTVVYDCCHSALMSRQRGLRIKAVNPLVVDAHRAGAVTYDSVARHLHDQVRMGLPLSRPNVHSNPRAVRIVACSTEQSAYEQDNVDSIPMGLLTDALTRVLAEAGDLPISWSVLIRRVRERVLNRTANQRPEAEGPSRRVPFGDADAEPVDTLAIVDLGGGRVELPGAPLLGTRPGDEFIVASPVPPGGAGTATTLGFAAVSHLTPMSAVARLQPTSDMQEVPPGARAWRSSAAATLLPVRIPPVAPLLTALEASMLVRPAEPDEDPAIEVKVDDNGRLAVHDRTGPLHEPVTADARGVARIADNLHHMAQATALRQLDGDPFDHGMTVTWGLVSPGGPVPLTGPDDLLHVGDHIWFRVRNDGRSTMYVSLLDIGLAGRIAVLNSHLPSGIPVAADADTTLGLDPVTGQVVGVPLSWPDTLPEAEHRLETVVLICSDDPVDVSVLQREGVRSADPVRQPLTKGSPLARLLTQIATGRSRDMGRLPRPATKYVVETIDFVVSPRRRPTIPNGT